MRNNMLLDCLKHFDLEDWSMKMTLPTKYVDCQAITDKHGRVVVITLYPEDPEIVTYDMWKAARSEKCDHTYYEYDETPHGDIALRCSKCGKIRIAK